MTDPDTIGTLAAAAFAMAAETVVKTGVGEGVKTAYAALKNKIAVWCGSDVEVLAKYPQSKVIAETIDQQSADDRAEIKSLALALNEALRNAAKAGVGIDLGRLEANNVRLGNINVFEGIGIRADEVKIPGDFSVDSLTVGKPKR
jgi:hypothetical protein